MRRYAELARESANGEPIAVVKCTLATVVLFDGDLEQALSLAHEGIERAWHDDDPAQLAWILGYTGMFESINQSDRTLPLSEEAIRVARSTGSTIALFYPLLSLMSATIESDPARALTAAEESMRLDRTRRATYLNQARMRASIIKVAQGEIAEGVVLWQEILRSYADSGERSVFSISLSGFARGLHPTTGAQPLTSLRSPRAMPSPRTQRSRTQPALTQLAEARPSEVADARRRFEGFSYEDAVEFLAVMFKRLISENAPRTSVTSAE